MEQDTKMAKGIIKRYDFRKGFGFINDDKNDEDYFFHRSEWKGDGPIRRGLAVKFIIKDSEKGPQAENVIPVNGDGGKRSSNNKPVSLEDRITSIERSLRTWKVLSFLAFAGIIALVVEKLIQ
ncbi:MAG: hypothetical protein CMF45_01970 [Legionellales bacterium]|nr:hypothetical protein [Legionellales bacterium]